MNAVTFEIPLEALSIEPADISAILGYGADVPSPVEDAIRECISKAALMPPLIGGYRVIELVELASDTLSANNVVMHIGDTIARQLIHTKRVAVFACTAGPALEKWSKELMEQDEFVVGYVADTLASEAVERAMDRIQTSLRKERALERDAITLRYSPGYCGWPVADQHALFSLLPERFCGIELTQSALMTPIKSISGIIGIGKSVQELQYGCSICELTTCFRRKK